MKKLRCYLVDDEEMVLKALKNIINRQFESLEIVGMAKSVAEAEKGIRLTNPDVVFLDIVMPVESGFELIKRFEVINFEIVFITSHAEYAIQAFQNLALAYLLKPVSISEFKKMLITLHERIELKEKSRLYEALIDNINSKNEIDQKIAVFVNNQFLFIRIGDIIRIEGWNRYSKIIVNNNKSYLSSYNIGKYSKLLLKHQFFLSHRSHLINLNYVESLKSEFEIRMTDKSIALLSTRRKPEFLDFLKVNNI